MRNMLTDRAKKRWEKRRAELADAKIKPYDGHDTVGAITLAPTGSMAAATSTSGLFMKRPGRVGDSPLSGSGFYVDSDIGGRRGNRVRRRYHEGLSVLRNRPPHG
ncbi:hypothetical protein N577_015390 [Lacticaseibacillus rhamnosus 2166]|nr:hypothetical protein N577_015390 [Lacticaseibacillus rhamnosus 2166]